MTGASNLRAGEGRAPAWRSWLLLLPALCLLALFAVGLLSAAAQSLGYQPYVGSTHLSLQAYRTLFADRGFQHSLVFTARTAAIATVASTALGVGCGLLLHGCSGGRRVGRFLFSLNLAVPHLVGALAISLLLAQSGLLSRVTHAIGLTGGVQTFPQLTGDGFGWGIVAEYVWKETPFIGVVTLAALGAGIDELERAARGLGAGALQRLRHVTLPMIAAPVTAASVLVLAYAFASYEVPLLLGRPYPTTLSVVAYQAYTDTDLLARPQAMAACVVLAVASSVFVLAYLGLVRRLSAASL